MFGSRGDTVVDDECWVPLSFGFKVACGWERSLGIHVKNEEKWEVNGKSRHTLNLRIYPCFSSFILQESLFHATTKLKHDICHALLHSLRMIWDSWLWLRNSLTTECIWMLSMQRVRVDVCHKLLFHLYIKPWMWNFRIHSKKLKLCLQTCELVHWAWRGSWGIRVVREWVSQWLLDLRLALSWFCITDNRLSEKNSIYNRLCC